MRELFQQIKQHKFGGIPLVPRPTLRILFLAVNPKDTQRLRLDEEIRDIDDALYRSNLRDKFYIEQQWAVRMDDLQGFLLRYKPDIVHFSGHGSSASEIILEDNTGNSYSVTPHALSRVFSLLKDNIRCVLLNACYSQQQAQAIAQHIDCVVGMTKAIGDAAAIDFARAFYQALGYGRSAKTAFDLGCAQIDLANLNEQDTPKLLASKCNPADLRFVENTPVDEVGKSGYMTTGNQGLGGIHAKRIRADNVVSGVQMQGGEPQQAAAMVSLAQAIRGGEIRANEITAGNLVSGLQYIADPAQATPEQLRQEITALRPQVKQAVAHQEIADSGEAEDVQQGLAEAEQELAKLQPNGQRVIRKLDEVNTILTRSAKIAQTTSKTRALVIQLAPVAATLWQVAQRLFGL